MPHSPAKHSGNFLFVPGQTAATWVCDWPRMLHIWECGGKDGRDPNSKLLFGEATQLTWHIR